MRADRQYRIATLQRSGAALSFGSDWPVSSGAPLDGIAVAVSRRTADGEPEGGWTPQEILPVEQALSAYTAAVAAQAFAENRWGRMLPGAAADLMLAQYNELFSLPWQRDNEVWLRVDLDG